MKDKSVFVLAVLFLCACPTYSDIYLNDGQTHNIDYEIHEGVYVDYQTPGMYTTVNWLYGAKLHSSNFALNPYILVGLENSRINVRGGSITHLAGLDSCQIDISGGSITALNSQNYNYTNISGGTIGSIFSFNVGQVDITGGSIENKLFLAEHSIIKIFGYDFAVDGQPVGFGELTTLMGDYPCYEPLRHLTGTLLSGEAIDCDFGVGHYAKIILIPEPASVLLLGLGGLLLKRRRR